MLVLDFLDISSDFTFFRGVDRLEGLDIEQNKNSKELKEETEVFLVAEEVYNLGPGRARVQRYAAWDRGGNLIEEVGDIITMLRGVESKKNQCFPLKSFFSSKDESTLGEKK